MFPRKDGDFISPCGSRRDTPRKTEDSRKGRRERGIFDSERQNNTTSQKGRKGNVKMKKFKKIAALVLAAVMAESSGISNNLAVTAAPDCTRR